VRQRAFLDRGLLDVAIAFLLDNGFSVSTQGWKPNGSHFSQLGQNRVTVIGVSSLVTWLHHATGAARLPFRWEQPFWVRAELLAVAPRSAAPFALRLSQESVASADSHGRGAAHKKNAEGYTKIRPRTPTIADAVPVPFARRVDQASHKRQACPPKLAGLDIFGGFLRNSGPDAPMR